MAFIHSIFDHISFYLYLSRFFFLNQIFVPFVSSHFLFVCFGRDASNVFRLFLMLLLFWLVVFFNSFSYSITFTLALWLVCTQLFDRLLNKKCLAYLAFSITHFRVSHWNNYIVFRRHFLFENSFQIMSARLPFTKMKINKQINKWTSEKNKCYTPIETCCCWQQQQQQKHDHSICGVQCYALRLAFVCNPIFTYPIYTLHTHAC